MPLDVNYYAIISDAVERGLQTGIRRVYKYEERSAMTEKALLKQANTIRLEIMNALCDYLHFTEEPDHAEWS